MREILFRAKRIDNGEWVEGFYSQLPKPSLGATIITNGDLCAEDVSDYIIVNESKQHSNFSDAYPIEVVECEYYEIDSETLCQYTGLTDKNGNRIWENDIVRTTKFGKDDGNGHNYAGFDVFVVKWDDGGFALFNKWRRFNLRTDEKSYEILGKAFDNPELLKGE